mmetsp:Transcript_45148/g.142141  ORF Transcript_45148/g.142141 Transcript_45148/m.142141 type:complete len:107 (+) Transcript_45148:730-1050(+)
MARRSAARPLQHREWSRKEEAEKVDSIVSFGKEPRRSTAGYFVASYSERLGFESGAGRSWRQHGASGKRIHNMSRRRKARKSRIDRNNLYCKIIFRTLSKVTSIEL